MALRTDYKDDILSSGNLRKYQMINNGDGTVSFQDVTVYQQTGDTFGAGDINNTNQAVNEKLDSDDVVDPMETTKSGFAADALAVKNAINEQNKNLGGLRFGVDGDGNYGYYGADDSLIPFSRCQFKLGKGAVNFTIPYNCNVRVLVPTVGNKYQIVKLGTSKKNATLYGFSEYDYGLCATAIFSATKGQILSISAEDVNSYGYCIVYW